MKLTDLLYKVYENTTVRIAENPSASECIYFGPAKKITLRTATAYEVVGVYPEQYPAIGNSVGITIIVKTESRHEAH